MAMNDCSSMLADFVDRANIGMVEGGRRARLPSKALQSLWVFCYVFGQKLQCDKSTKLCVLSLVNDAHPAAAQLLDDAVVRDGLADHAQACYGGSMSKSMKAEELAVSRKA